MFLRSSTTILVNPPALRVWFLQVLRKRCESHLSCPSPPRFGFILQARPRSLEVPGPPRRVLVAVARSSQSRNGNGHVDMSYMLYIYILLIFTSFYFTTSTVYYCTCDGSGLLHLWASKEYPRGPKTDSAQVTTSISTVSTFPKSSRAEPHFTQRDAFRGLVNPAAQGLQRPWISSVATAHGWHCVAPWPGFRTTQTDAMSSCPSNVFKHV